MNLPNHPTLTMTLHYATKKIVIVAPTQPDLVADQIPLGLAEFCERAFTALAFAMENVGPWNKLVDDLVATTEAEMKADPSKRPVTRRTPITRPRDSMPSAFADKLKAGRHGHDEHAVVKCSDGTEINLGKHPKCSVCQQELLVGDQIGTQADASGRYSPGHLKCFGLEYRPEDLANFVKMVKAMRPDDPDRIKLLMNDAIREAFEKSSPPKASA